MFTRLGRHYAWATPDRVADMTFPQISMYLRGIGDNLYRETYPTLRLGYSFEALLRGFQENPRPMPAWLEFVPPWMQVETPAGQVAAPFSPIVVDAWRAAVSLGVASNQDLALLGYQKLKASGW